MSEADEKWAVGWRGGLCTILSMGGFSIHSMPSPPLGLSEGVACEASINARLLGGGHIF